LTYDPERHHRQSIRLRGYDYTQAGLYFVTICAQDRACLFADIEDEAIQLTAIGEIVAACWLAVPDHFPAAELDEFVVMPNHMHGILVLGGHPVDVSSATSGVGTACRAPTGGGERFGRPVAGSVPTIVRSFKAAVTKAVNDDPGRGTACRALLADRLGPLPSGRIPSLWQRNYYENVIRDERALDRIRTYVAANPSQWAEDTLHPDHPNPFPLPRHG
jgi:putative transposase